MGKECISGSAHVDHRSETVEKKRIIHMIPSLWGSGRAGIRFPSIAAFPRWSRIPSLPQRWETASASSCPVCLASADPNFLTSPGQRGASPQRSRPRAAGKPNPASCTPPQPHQASPCGRGLKWSRPHWQLLASWWLLWEGWLWHPWPRPCHQSS